LRGLFDEFSNQSLARTMPPGTAAVRRTVRRRYATRAVVLAVAALVVLSLAFVPLRTSHSQPVQPSPTPSVSTSSLSPRTSPTGPRIVPGATTTTTTAPTPACDPNNNAYAGFNLSQPAPDEYELTPSMLAACPSLRIWLAQGTYVGAGANSATVTRTSSRSVVLSASNPTATLAPAFPAPSCASVVVVTYIGYTGAPKVLASMANPVPHLVATGDTSDLSYYVLQHGSSFKEASWQAPTC
jgi:hypothetical protein